MAMLIGKKLGMTRFYDESGRVTPVSVIEAGPCPIVQVKTVEGEGYAAIQIGFGEAKEKHTTNPVLGHCKKAGLKPLRMLREVRVEDVSTYKVGEAIDVKVFEGVKHVNVTGTSKGHGFTGTIKRHNFQRGRKTHGNKNYREPGSTGCSAYPSRVLPGKRMAGRHGGVRRTARNLELVGIDAENNLLFVRGAVPGASSGIVVITTSQR